MDSINEALEHKNSIDMDNNTLDENCNDISTQIISDFVRNTQYDAIEIHEMNLVDDDTFYALAEKVSSSPKLSYKEYIQLKDKVSNSLKKYFTPSSFLLFCKDTNGIINADEFLR